jgi:hypothetical protein
MKVRRSLRDASAGNGGWMRDSPRRGSATGAGFPVEEAAEGGVATSCLSCGCVMNWAHAEGPPVMLKQFGLIGGVGIVAGVAALYWVQPDTIGGQSLLFIVVFALVGGLLELMAVLLRFGNGKQSEES